MPINYFYEPDCLNLNQEARLNCIPPNWLAHCIKKLFQKKQSKNAEKHRANKEIINQITTKLQDIKEQINWKQNLLEASFVIFDSETTGLDPLRGDKVISLSGVILENGAVKTDAVFDKLIDPMRSVPPRSTSITGITDSMVSNAPTLFEVLPEFLDFIDNKILVAHYAPFDMAFLNIELGRHAPLRIHNPVIDTCLLARNILPGIPGYSLDSLLKKFNIKIEGRHTALGDSLMTAQLFIKLLEKLAEKEIFTLEQLRCFLAGREGNGKAALD